MPNRPGQDLVTPCNGCYGTLKGAKAELKANPKLMAHVNERLAEIGMEYKGKIKVYHLLELFHDVLSPAKIATYVKKPLKGMRIGVHYGCHMMRPAKVLNFDDPIKPVKFDALVSALGAKSLDYSTKMLCCGGGLSNVGNVSEGQTLVRRKLQDLKGMEADAMTTVCPSCYSQYDMQQFMLAREGEKYNIPVISYQELLALSMGFTPEEIGMDMHKVDTAAFMNKWEKNLGRHLKAKEIIDVASVERCVACAACVNDCPVTLSLEGVNLHDMMKTRPHRRPGRTYKVAGHLALRRVPHLQGALPAVLRHGGGIPQAEARGHSRGLHTAGHQEGDGDVPADRPPGRAVEVTEEEARSEGRPEDGHRRPDETDKEVGHLSDI